MLNPKYVDSTKHYVVSGVKEIGDYIYILMINMSGQTLIKRVKSDNSEIKFVVRPKEETITNFWEDPTQHEYKYIHTL